MNASHPVFPALVFVDIETTGGTPGIDEIIEVAIIRYENGKVREFQQLFRPRGKIPRFIQQLTGISNRLVAHEPPIEGFLGTMYDFLQDAVFVAHNVHFDFDFLNQQFKNAGWPELPNSLLCSHKLAKQLYPEDRKHGVSALIAKFNLKISARHRALGDAQAIYQFWHIIRRDFPEATLLAAVRSVLQEENGWVFPELNLKDYRKTPGVFLFFRGEDPILMTATGNIHNSLKALGKKGKGARSPADLMTIDRIEVLEAEDAFDASLMKLKLTREYESCYAPVAPYYYSITCDEDADGTYTLRLAPTDYSQDFWGLYKSAGMLERSVDAWLTKKEIAYRKSSNPENTAIDFILKPRDPEKTYPLERLKQDLNRRFEPFVWPKGELFYLKVRGHYYLFSHWRFVAAVKSLDESKELAELHPIIPEKETLLLLKKHLSDFKPV